MTNTEFNVMQSTIKQIVTNNNDEVYRLKKLAAEMAHEVQNPLTTIKGFLQLMKPNLTGVGKEEYADIVLEEIDRVNEIISEFVNKTKPSHTPYQPVSLNQMLNRMIKFYESESTIRNIKLIPPLNEDEIIVMFKEKELKQVFVNLIKNAMEAIEECNDRKGLISLHTEVRDSFVYVHIIDNGCGMSKEISNHLFTPFFTTKKQGTGIGLSICKEIIIRNQGSIYMTSEINKGTKFTIVLPIHKKEEKANNK